MRGRDEEGRRKRGGEGGRKRENEGVRLEGKREQRLGRETGADSGKQGGRDGKVFRVFVLVTRLWINREAALLGMFALATLNMSCSNTRACIHTFH